VSTLPKKEANVDLSLLKYSPDHLWVKLDEDNNATIGVTEEGLTDYIELTSIRLPSEGDEFQKDQQFGRITVGKGIGLKLLAPFAGEVIAVNEDILEAPDVIMEDPYEEGWLVRMDIHWISEYDDLMSREEYDEYLVENEADNPSDDDDDDDDDDDSDLFFLDDDDEDEDDEDEDDDDEDDEDSDYYDDDDDDDNY
jgi:glycine cleavage system H protein